MNNFLHDDSVASTTPIQSNFPLLSNLVTVILTDSLGHAEDAEPAACNSASGSAVNSLYKAVSVSNALAPAPNKTLVNSPDEYHVYAGLARRVYRSRRSRRNSRRTPAISLHTAAPARSSRQAWRARTFVTAEPCSQMPALQVPTNLSSAYA